MDELEGAFPELKVGLSFFLLFDVLVLVGEEGLLFNLHLLDLVGRFG